MPLPLPYGLRKIWIHPANRAPGGLGAVRRRLGRSAAWASYQLQKQVGLFPAQGRVIPWVDGLRVRLLSTSQLSQACLYYGLPDWPSMQFLRRYLRPGDLCADIGANVGIYTLLMARHAGAEGVHAFECLPSNIPKLRSNLQLNGFDAVSIHPLALADRDGRVLLNVSDGDSTASISPPGGADAEPQAEAEASGWVPASRLDGLPWSEPFAFIKIDVEGAEQLVLAGSEGLLRSDPPRVWSFEYLNSQQRLGSSKAALLEAFARWDYRFFLYRPNRNQLLPFTPDSEAHAPEPEPQRQDDNILAIHASALEQVAMRLCGLA